MKPFSRSCLAAIAAGALLGAGILHATDANASPGECNAVWGFGESCFFVRAVPLDVDPRGWVRVQIDPVTGMIL